MNIFFDLDGTLLDVSQRHYHVYAKVVKSLGGQALDKEVYWKLKRRKCSIETIVGQSRLPQNLVPLFLKRFIVMIERPVYLRLDSLLPHARRVLKILSKTHSLYLVTARRSTTNLKKQLKSLGLKTSFGANVYSLYVKGTKVGKSKILHRLNRDQSGFIVGDTEEDILAARQAKLKSIIVLSGLRNRKTLLPFRPDYLIADVRKLPPLVERLLKNRKNTIT